MTRISADVLAVPTGLPASESVYGGRRRPLRRASLALLGATLLVLGMSALVVPVAMAQSGDQNITQAREALRRKDTKALDLARATASAEQHPLASWVDYWELNNRLNTAQQDELNAFYARWSGSYVEDRLRNDWLLELGRRRDWANFAIEFPRFRMNDDREVTCYALLVERRAGKDVRDDALAAWLTQRDGDDGCAMLASTLFDAKELSPDAVWRKARFAVDAGRPRAARQAVMLIGAPLVSALNELLDNPARYLNRRADTSSRQQAELTTLALIRLAGSDAEAAEAELRKRWGGALPDDLSSWAWAAVAKQAAMKLLPEASDLYQQAALQGGKRVREQEWPDETLAWKARAALRADAAKVRWQQVMQAINAMSPAEQRDPTWVYWKARALQVLGRDSQDGEAMRAMAQELMAGLAGQMHFYGKLASEELGVPIAMPPRPAPLTAAERETAARLPGLARALQLIALGLRNEGVREWNYTLRGMSDRELMAAAQVACDREIWDRCINTSDRTKVEVDMAQRFPTPHSKEVQARAREIGLDPAYVYGLIRQESRFVMDARSPVGASGLMQIMPATARWTARKMGLAYTPDMITDRDTNLRIGTGYLKLVLDDFGGSQAMAAAAYNAGPGRPRRWREGPVLEVAAWAENIPFAETRDYVKKVLSNATWYSALMSGKPPALKARLGGSIGPREATATAPSIELP